MAGKPHSILGLHLSLIIETLLGDLHESDSSRVFWRPPAPGNNNTFYFKIVLIYVLFSVTNKRIFFSFSETISGPKKDLKMSHLH